MVSTHDAHEGKHGRGQDKPAGEALRPQGIARSASFGTCSLKHPKAHISMHTPSSQEQAVSVMISLDDQDLVSERDARWSNSG